MLKEKMLQIFMEVLKGSAGSDGQNYRILYQSAP
jgi:hypothetical protein